MRSPFHTVSPFFFEKGCARGPENKVGGVGPAPNARTKSCPAKKNRRTHIVESKMPGHGAAWRATEAISSRGAREDGPVGICWGLAERRISSPRCVNVYLPAGRQKPYQKPQAGGPVSGKICFWPAVIVLILPQKTWFPAAACKNPFCTNPKKRWGTQPDEGFIRCPRVFTVTFPLPTKGKNGFVPPTPVVNKGGKLYGPVRAS